MSLTTASVNLHGDPNDFEPRLDVLRLDDGSRFVVLRFGNSADVIVPGRDIDTAIYLRRLAKACDEAADQMHELIISDNPEEEVA